MWNGNMDAEEADTNNDAGHVIKPARNKIDRIAQVILPGIFVVFNIVYFVYYMNSDGYRDNYHQLCQ